jgi:hypothetical protein
MMAVYRIVCVHRVTTQGLLEHGHVIAVGTVDDGSALTAPTAAWTAGEIVRAAEEGDRFVVGPPTASIPVTIDRQVCPKCGMGFIQIEPMDALRGIGDCQL